MDDGLLRQPGLEDLVPPHHPLAVLLENREQPLIEVGLQAVHVRDLLLLHERLDLRIGRPLLAVVLVPADVPVRVWEDLHHLAHEAVDEPVGGFARRIERRIEHAEPARDGVRPRRAREFRIPDDPARDVPGHVELRHDANAPLPSVFDDVAQLILRVVVAVRSHFVQLRVLPALDAEALVFAQVKVQHVQLDRGHTIELPLDHLDRLEMAPDIDQQPTPAKPRSILDVDSGNEESARIAGHELQESLEAAHRAHCRRRVQHDLGSGRDQAVRLILIQRRDGRARTLAFDHKGCRGRVGRVTARHHVARAAFQPPHRALDRRAQPVVLEPAQRYGGRRRDGHATVPDLHRGRHGHQ